MFNRKELKERAKLVLMRSYAKVFLACLIVNFLAGGGFGISTKRVRNIDVASMPPQKLFAVFATVTMLALIAIAVSVFVLSPLKVGLKKFMTENAIRDAQLDLLLMPFRESYKNIVKVQFIKNLFISLWSIPAVLPTIVLFVITDTTIPLINGVYTGSAND